jgi:hypothetical protein
MRMEFERGQSGSDRQTLAVESTGWTAEEYWVRYVDERLGRIPKGEMGVIPGPLLLVFCEAVAAHLRSIGVKP